MFSPDKLNCPAYKNPPASLKRLVIPNDIVKEIVDQFGNTLPWDKKDLRSLRLVNHTFSAFAAEKLFKGFDTLNLANSFEEIAPRGRAFQRSHLRSRIKNLRVSVTAILPQTLVKQIERNYWDDTSLLRLHDAPHVVECMEEFVVKVEEALGPKPRFEGLILDFAASNVMGSQEYFSVRRERDGCRPSRLLRVAWFRKCVIEMMKLPQFSKVRSLRTNLWRYGPRDLLARYDDYDREQAVLPGLENEEKSQRLAETFWSKVNELGIEVLDIHLTIRDWFDLSDFTAIGEIARRSGVKRLNLQSLDFNHLYEPGDGPLREIEAFRLVDGQGWRELVFGSTIATMENLRSLELINVRMNKELSIATEINSFLNKNHALTHIRFEALGYYRTKLGDDRRIYEPTTGERYFLPVYSSRDKDIEAFSQLRTVVEKRREEEGLEQDLWLSVFCVRPDVLHTEIKDTGYDSEGNSNQDWDSQGWNSEENEGEEDLEDADLEDGDLGDADLGDADLGDAD